MSKLIITRHFLPTMHAKLTRQTGITKYSVLMNSRIEQEKS